MAAAGPSLQVRAESRQVNRGAGNAPSSGVGFAGVRKHREIPLIVLGVLMLISIGVELVAGSSGCALLRKNVAWTDPFFAVLVSFFCAESVLKVAETIGVCSILVAWIYAALDKTELGIRYDELVQRKLPGYHGYVVVHFVGVLVCLWLSTAGMTESAVLALCGVLYASLLQWKVLYGVVLSSGHRRELALGIWDCRAEAAQSAEEIKAVAINMIGVIAKQGAAEAAPLIEKLVTVELEYGRRCRMEHETDGLKLAVEDAAWFWGQLLQGSKKSERIYVARDLFSCCNRNECDYGMICAGYVLWWLNDAITFGNQVGREEAEILGEVLNIISITVRGKIERSIPELLRDLYMVFVAIAYQVCFRVQAPYRSIPECKSIPRHLLSVWDRQPGPCLMRELELLRAVSEFYFREPWEPYFSITIRRMWGNRMSQGVGR